MAYRPTDKTRAQKLAKQERILITAVELVSEQGFQGLTISQVAARAEVATGSIYKYFESKQTLCAEVFKLATIKEVEKVREQALSDTNITCTQRLLNAIEVFAQRAIRGRRMAYALIAEPVDPTVEHERLIYRQTYANIYAQLIEDGIARSEFRPQLTSISAAAIVGALSEALVGPLTIAVQNNKDIDTSDLIDSMQQFCLSAVARNNT